MKKIISLTLALLMVLALFAACSRTDGGAPEGGPSEGDAPNAAATGTAAIESLKTLGDALKAGEEGGNVQTAMFEGYFIYAFEQDGTFYRVITHLPDDVFEEVFALEWDDEQHDEKMLAIVGDQPIDIYENLSDTVIPQEELDALVGKTGQELFDDGWTSSGWNLETMEFWMNKGALMYTVVFDGQVDDFDAFEEQDIADMTVKSVTYQGIGDATNIELDDAGNIIG